MGEGSYYSAEETHQHNLSEPVRYTGRHVENITYSFNGYESTAIQELVQNPYSGVVRTFSGTVSTTPLRKVQADNVLEDEEFRAFLKALGARIRSIRKAKNFDMRHIMITSGYYDAQWRKYETGGSLNLQSLLKIALTLDTPLDDLFDGLGQWPRKNVEEIEKARCARLGSLDMGARVAEVKQALHAPEPGTKASSKKSKKVSDADQPVVSAKTRTPKKARPQSNH